MVTCKDPACRRLRSNRAAFDAGDLPRDSTTAQALTIVNFGCGPYPHAGCINIDGSPSIVLARLPFRCSSFGSRRELIHAVRAHAIRFGRARSLRFAEHSLDGFYASHTLEHLSRADCAGLLQRTRHWLKPTGVLRVVLPDLRVMAIAYVEERLPADIFIEQTFLAVDGMVAMRPSQHRWMYDVASFSRLLSDLGYRNVRQCGFRQGRIEEMARIDLEQRRMESFYVEADP